MASHRHTTGFNRSISGAYLSVYYEGTEVQRYNASKQTLLKRLDFSSMTAAAADTDGAIIKAGSSTTPASTPIATQAASTSMVRIITGLDHTSSYGVYFRSYVRTAAISADAFRAFGTVLDVAADTARGAHISLSYGTSGTVTGLGAALEATLHVPTTAGMAGTNYAVKAAINSDAATSDPAGATTIGFFGVVNQGDATGGADVDDDAVLFHFDGFTVGDDNMIDTAATEYALSEITHGVKCKVGSTTVWLLGSTTNPKST